MSLAANSQAMKRAGGRVSLPGASLNSWCVERTLRKTFQDSCSWTGGQPAKHENLGKGGFQTRPHRTGGTPVPPMNRNFSKQQKENQKQE